MRAHGCEFRMFFLLPHTRTPIHTPTHTRAHTRTQHARTFARAQRARPCTHACIHAHMNTCDVRCSPMHASSRAMAGLPLSRTRPRAQARDGARPGAQSPQRPRAAGSSPGATRCRALLVREEVADGADEADGAETADRAARPQRRRRSRRAATAPRARADGAHGVPGAAPRPPRCRRRTGAPHTHPRVRQDPPRTQAPAPARGSRCRAPASSSVETRAGKRSIHSLRELEEKLGLRCFYRCALRRWKLRRRSFLCEQGPAETGGRAGGTAERARKHTAPRVRPSVWRVPHDGSERRVVLPHVSAPAVGAWPRHGSQCALSARRRRVSSDANGGSRRAIHQQCAEWIPPCAVAAAARRRHPRFSTEGGGGRGHEGGSVCSELQGAGFRGCGAAVASRIDSRCSAL